MQGALLGLEHRRADRGRVGDRVLAGKDDAGLLPDEVDGKSGGHRVEVRGEAGAAVPLTQPVVVVVEMGLEDEGAGVLDVVVPDAGPAEAGADAGQEALAEVLPGVILAGQEPGDQFPVRPEVLDPRGGVVGHAVDCSRKARDAPSRPVPGWCPLRLPGSAGTPGTIPRRQGSDGLDRYLLADRTLLASAADISDAVP